MLRFLVLIPALVQIGVVGVAHAGEPDRLTVLAVSPPAGTQIAPAGTSIEVTFDRAVDPTSITTERFNAFARTSGAVDGDVVVSRDGRTVTLVPDTALFAGESVVVQLSHELQAIDGTTLRDAGYSWRFWTRAKPSSFDLVVVDTLPTGLPGEPTTPYGASATDLDHDGWPDVTTINEASDDARVFMNRGDGSGLLAPFMPTTFPLGAVPSPNEPADFNHDGHADLCVAATVGAAMSILLGNGDGTYGPEQQFALPGMGRGIAALDVDGDADADVVAACFTSSNLALFINDDGVFSPAGTLDAGFAGEWGLAAADMNRDGIMDLVIGSRSTQQVSVRLGNGDGSFAAPTVHPGGGSIWMLVIADVNGDGLEDVATANSSSNSGSILLGDGLGGVLPPTTYAADPFALATDLGDLDGDGDPDWVLSSFNGDWRIYENTGDGSFQFAGEVPAAGASSCATLADLDRDGDLDLVLIDEVADLLHVVHNSGTTRLGDLNGDGAVDGADAGLLLAEWHGDDVAADLDENGVVDGADLGLLLSSWTG